MARAFKELEANMRPESLGRAKIGAKIGAKEMMAGMLLSELRRAVGLTQEQLAASLGSKQPSLSRLESQDDMQISTLRQLVAALGGDLAAQKPGCFGKAGLHLAAAVFTEGDSQVIGLLK